MPSGLKWTTHETSLLVNAFESSDNVKLAELFPTRTLSAVHKRALKLGLRVPPEIEYQNRPNSRKREKCPNWRGGIRYTRKGYRQILIPEYHRADSAGYVMEHIYVWEQAHGAYVPEGYVIHHLNGIKDDNRVENLVLMTREEHTKLHHTGAKRSEETKRKISEKRRRRL